MARPHHVAAGAIVVAGLAAALITFYPRKPHRDPPPVIAAMPRFQLTDQSGKPFDSDARLAGKPWVANFIFTRCTTVCPVFTAKMARFEEQTRDLGDDLRLVSFSVDPEYDTPEVLARYAEAHKANLARWSFLTGPTGEIKRVVTDSLKIAVEKQPGQPVGQSILHGTHFALVDGAMRIRGYYDLADADALERMLADVAVLGAEQRKKK
jgi:protein SCO1/2